MAVQQESGSVPSGQGGRSLTDLEQPFDLDRRVARQRRHADRAAGMAAGIAKHLDRKIGRAVHHRGMLGEAGRAGDEAAEAHDAEHLVQIPVASGAQLGQHVDEA